MKSPVQPGILALLKDHRDWIQGRRVALISHHAAVDARGHSAADLLHGSSGFRLVALFGPEHGFDGLSAAGQSTTDGRHAKWDIPIYSLYGRFRKPTAEMLRGADVLVYDIQDLGARPYTYVSTLRYCLEAAAECEKRFIVADRPVPLPLTVDGPALDSALESFVGCVRTPMVYGMTPGETALWLRTDLKLRLDLRIARLRHYTRQPRRGKGWPKWIPPSPRIRDWSAGQCYAATVFTEALPIIDNGSGTDLVFQVLGTPLAPRKGELAKALRSLTLPGVRLEPVVFTPASGIHTGKLLHGVRLRVHNPALFRPVWTAVAILGRLQKAFGKEALWSDQETSSGFFDQLFGTRSVRESLQAGESAASIAAGWEESLRQFRATRNTSLLYGVT